MWLHKSKKKNRPECVNTPYLYDLCSQPLLVIINRAIIITFTFIIIIITRSNAALRAVNLDWIVCQDTVWAGTFWGVLNVLLRVSWQPAQIGLNLLCHPSWEKFDTDETWQTPHQHNIWIITMFRPSERSGSWTLVVEDCQPEDSGSYRCQVRESSVCLSVFSSRLLVSEISNPILCLWRWFVLTI